MADDRLVAITGGDYSDPRREERERLLRDLADQGTPRAGEMLRDEERRRPADDQLRFF